MMPHTDTTEAGNASAQIGLGFAVSVRIAPPRRVPAMTVAPPTTATGAAQQSELPRVAMGGRPGPLRVRGSVKASGDVHHDQWRRNKDGREADEAIAEHGPHHVRWSRRLQRDVRVGDMPDTRADCPTGPCPWVRCRHHMATEVHHDGSLIVHNEGPWPTNDMPARKAGLGLDDSIATEIASGRYETCGLRLAEQGPRGIVEIAEVMGLCRQQVAKDEQAALAKLRELSFGAISIAEALAGMSDDTGQDWPDWGG